MRRLLLIILIFGSLGVRLFGQVSNPESFISGLVEEMQESETSEATIEEIVSTLTLWMDEKPNINVIKADEMLSYKLLSPMQAAEIFDYKKKNGDILTPFELVHLSSFDQKSVELLMAFFSFGNRPERSKSLKQYFSGRHELLAQYNDVVENQIGYDNGAYLGSPGKAYMRYKYTYRQELTMGLTAEKDPGEPFFEGDNATGFDFYSMHFFLEPDKFISTVALGDYQVTLGQGLVCGQGIWGGKNTAAISNRNARQGFKPYSSATEYGFMRGAALEATYKNFRAGIFGSFQKIDATIDTLDSPYLSSISSTGLHRTENEMLRKNAADELVVGGFLEARLGTLKLNLNGIFSQYEHEIVPSSNIYDLYDPAGASFGNMSVGYMYQLSKITMFGELAVSDAGALAQLHSAVFYPSESIGLSVLYRNYARDYVTMQGYSFGESSGVQNEEGFYFGLEWLPFKYTTVNLYADFFKFPWMRYGEKAPTDGAEYMIDIAYSPKRTIRFNTRFKFEDKSTTVAEGAFPNIVYGNLFKWHFQGTFNYTPELSGQARIAYAHFDQDTVSYSGWLMYYEHFYKPGDGAFQASFRVNVFDVEDYTARLYTYERDVLYSFSVPSFQDTGVRFYLNLKWDVLDNLSLYARVDRTEFLHKATVSSGNELIRASHKTGIHTKLRWKF